ncbi:MAG TPA: polyprenyl diphosphate synthase [Candidatus Baltobacteraceae bacterium]|nr:polyprenyl diphosphate synthase [Candidatus Baltobacteraceae bacterium]
MRHLAIIPDGNRRWAKARGLPALEGHRRGYENIKRVGSLCLERGIEQMTFFAFSTENWQRGQDEVSYLMDLIRTALEKDVDFYLKEGVRLRVIGRRQGLSDKLVAAIDAAERRTAGGARGQLNICLNYGGRAEIVEAVRAIMKDGTPPEAVDEELISKRVWTAGIPDPDLIIRTSGERRLSGFMTWSGIYSELMFVEPFWPDFGAEALDAALAEYARRERRFGA